MPLTLLAVAEADGSWECISQRLANTLRPGEWQTIVPYQGHVHSDAAVAIEPADPVTVQLREGLLLVHASTGPWGPGYHQRVVAILDALAGAIPGGWSRVEDTTGYWERRSRAALERSFLAWAHTLWSEEQLLRLAARKPGAAVCLGLGEGPAEVPRGLVATPTGFKSRDWVDETCRALEQALENTNGAGTPARARDAFLWWNAVPDARDWVQLGRAVCTSDVIWRPVAGEDAPEQVHARERAMWCFESALRLDPEAPVPWPELRRLLGLLGRDPGPLATVVDERAEDGRFEGGYREGWIRRPLAGHWNVQLPGWLRATCDASDGHDVFWDDRMTVHVTAIRSRNGSFSPTDQARRHLSLLPEPVRDHARVEYVREGDVAGYVITIAGLPEIDTMVTGQVARAGERVTFTVVARSPEATLLAQRLGRSVRPISV